MPFAMRLRRKQPIDRSFVKSGTSFHLQVGEALERLFPERKTELAPLLAHHFLASRRPIEELTTPLMAGDEAFRLYAHRGRRSTLPSERAEGTD